MSLQTLGYIGLRTKNLEDWTVYAERFLGMQLVDKSRGTASFRMDDKKQRLHSVAFIESGKVGIHHLMVETCYLDDVGQCYDIAQKTPEMIATTFGRHYNDQVHSFYSWSPSKFMFEYGWGGRTTATENW